MCEKDLTCEIPFLIVWFLVCVGIFIALLVINPTIPAAGATLTSILPIGGSGNLTTAYRYTFRFKLTSGRKQNITIEHFNGTIFNLAFDFDRIGGDCLFDNFAKVCDADIDISRTNWGCWPFETKCSISPDSCKAEDLCTYTEEKEPICAFSSQLCSIAELVPTACYEVRYLDPEDCTVVGNFTITNGNVENSFPISDSGIPKTGSLGWPVNFVDIEDDFPFADKLFIVNSIINSVSIKDHSALEEASFCITTAGDNCLGPVQVHDSGTLTAFRQAMERIEKWHIGWSLDDGSTVTITEDNDLISTAFVKSDPLETILGSGFKLNATSDMLFFELHEASGSIQVTVDIPATFISETFPKCDINFIGVDCDGNDLQQYMKCILDVQVGHILGGDVIIFWNGDQYSYPCESKVYTLPATLRTDEAAFSYETFGSARKFGKADIVIEEIIDYNPPVEKDLDGNDIDPDKVYKEELAELLILRNWCIAGMISIVVLWIIVSVISLWPWLKELFPMNNGDGTELINDDSF